MGVLAFVSLAALIRCSYAASVAHLRRVKVYVYTSEDTSIVSNLTACRNKNHVNEFWGTEWWFHDILKRSSHRVLNPRDADFFFVPVYARCLFRQHWQNEQHNSRAVDELYIAALRKLPYLASASVQRHVFLFTNARGPAQFASWRDHIPGAIFITPEPHFTTSHPTHAPYFDVHKDVLMPGHTPQAMQAALLARNKPASHRRHLATYPKATERGRETRLQVVRLGEAFPQDLRLTGDYVELLTDSVFCLLPRGAGSWTRRTYEAIMAGCIPVLLSDHTAMPFERSIDYRQFIIKWPASAVNETLLIALRNVPLNIIETAREAMSRALCMFQWQHRDAPCSPFAGIMSELAVRAAAARPLASWQRI